MTLFLFVVRGPINYIIEWRFPSTLMEDLLIKCVLMELSIEDFEGFKKKIHIAYITYINGDLPSSK